MGVLRRASLIPQSRENNVIIYTENLIQIVVRMNDTLIINALILFHL